MGKELSTDVIDVEIEKGWSEVDDLTKEPASTEYSDISDMMTNLGQQTEKLVRDQVLPEKGVIGEVSTTDMVIDLSLANIAKQTSIKLQKMEKFLGKIEDKLFGDKMLEEMNKGELMALYTTTRLMRTDAFKMLTDIRKSVDFSALEATLLSMHSKESMKDESGEKGGKMKSMLESILTNPDFLIQAAQSQKKKLTQENEDD